MHKRVLSVWVAGFAAWMNGCGEDSKNTTPAASDFQCTADKSGWEQCVDNKVEYCHIVEGMEPHFHWGSDCQALGFQCVELSESQAACLDPTRTCAVGQFVCQDNTALNCVAYGGQEHWTLDPCGTAATCKQDATQAFCEHADVAFDPQNACDAMTATATESKAVTSTFASVFAPDYHAELGIRAHVTLPDSQVSYIHFPVYSCGEFAMFVDQVSVVDGIQHRNQTEVLLSGGTAVDLCSSNIPEHWHADLEWDGDGTEGTDPVPYVLRFKAIPGGAEINFAVFQIASEHE